MTTHKDLPPGSQKWASDVDALMAENKALKEVVRRLCENAGIDMANPQRGINTGDTPSIKNPVGQKLSSLADVNTYNVADGQYLSWSGKGQAWLPVTPAAGGGINWVPATEDETLNQLLDSDSDYYSTQVIGIHGPTEHEVRDSYGLVGTSNTSAFLHGSQRGFGGSTEVAHGYVTAQPYYVNMGVLCKDDNPEVIGWRTWGRINIDRKSIYLTTPKHQSNTYGDDGSIVLLTNWFHVPLFATADRPTVPFGDPAGYKGAMIYDTDLNIPLWFNGTTWTNALGTAV